MLTIMELNWEDGMTYRDSFDPTYIWRVDSGHLYNQSLDDIFEVYSSLKTISELTFTQDWNSVKLNTKILVSNDKKNWHRCYFAGLLHNGTVLTFQHGRNQWANDCESLYEEDKDLISWRYAKLAEI